MIVGNNKSRLICVVSDDPPEVSVSSDTVVTRLLSCFQLECSLMEPRMVCLLSIEEEAAYGIASGKIHCQEELQSNMGKHRQGGQSAQRFERLIEKRLITSSNEQPSTPAIAAPKFG